MGLELERLRREIDAVDASLVPLLRRRMEIVADVAAEKKKTGAAVQDGGREAAVLDKVGAQAGETWSPYVRAIYATIFAQSKAYQRTLLGLARPDGQENSSEKQYGLIGQPLAHSHSVQVHAMLAPYRYELFPLAPEEVAPFLRRPDIGGLNVTIPYKQLVMPLCDALSPRAQQIGAVNTLVYDAQGHITGHNTDYDGFAAMAQAAGIAFSGRKVVILGSGGTARTAAQVCADQGAREVVIVSRQGRDNYQNLQKHANAHVLINTTPVGMFPHGEESPVSLAGFAHLEGVLDVVYNPLRTNLVQAAQARGIPACGGLLMLVWQAAASAALFLGREMAEEQIGEAFDRLRAQVENIVLIGMPGCGKTAIGTALSVLTGRPLIDSDIEIEARMGKPIPRIFQEDGEEAFRREEKAVLAEAAARSGVIIATGGGSVLDANNVRALRRNGRIVHLTRPLEKLAVDGRPLSCNLAAMASVRMPLYRAAEDVSIANETTIEAAARAVWEAFAL